MYRFRFCDVSYLPKPANATSPAGRNTIRLEHLDLFDAIEHSQIHLPWLNFNKRALSVATEQGKPVIANSDAHDLWMFGRHYTLVDAAPVAGSIFRAIRAGHLEWVSPPITIRECLKMFVTDPLLHRKHGRLVTSFER